MLTLQKTPKLKLTEAEPAELRQVAGGTELVEDMVVPLLLTLAGNTRLLQQVGAHVCSCDAVAGVEADLDVLAETTAVVVASSLCIANGL